MNGSRTAPGIRESSNSRKKVFNEQQLSKGMVERMSDRKRQLLKESIQFEGLRELYKLYLSKQ
jgi:hypothetical protein